MADIYWIRITTNFFNDEKIKLIGKLPKGDSIILIWLHLLTLAGKHYSGGYVSLGIPYTEKNLSIVLGRSLSLTQLALKTFLEFGMIQVDEKGIFILNFDKHQSIEKLEKIQENNRERQRRHYNKTKNSVQNKNNLTLGSRYSNTTEKEIEIEIEKDA